MRRMVHLCLLVTILCLWSLAFGETTASQDRRTPHSNSLRVFIDCFFCDKNYIKSELPYLTYVRERQQSDVHLLLSDQGTGAGGTEHTVTFLGQGQFAGMNDTLRFITQQVDSEDDVRQQLVKIIQMGMVQYLARTSMRKRLDISYALPTTQEKQSGEAVDPWNHWIFDINLNTSLSGQQTTHSANLSGSINAHRVTRQWKLMLLASGDYQDDQFYLDSKNYNSISRNRQYRLSVVRSLGPHLSAGVWGSLITSTFENLKTEFVVEPRLEYNYFPYAQSTRRQLRFVYAIGPKFRNYFKETIYYKTEERLWQESFSMILDMIQPWGSVHTSVTGSHYFHEFSLNRLNVSGSLSLNLVKGLSLDVSGSFSRIHDQLSLPREGTTPEEILLRRQQLQTNYNYQFKVGLSYTFGSIYDSIVNPRFGGWWFI